MAATYEKATAPQMIPAARDLVSMAAPPEGGTVLDVGTGTGVALEAAQAAVGATGVAVGVDMSVEMLKAGHSARPTLRLAAADAIDLPFRDATFDAVTANFVISHFTKYETALFDMIRVLRSGGRLAVSAWGPGDDEFTKAWRELAEEVVGHDLLQDAYRQVMPWNERFSRPYDLETTLRDAGLHPVRVERKEYRLKLSRDAWLAGRAGAVSGRFAHQMLGDDGFEGFLDRARSVFAERFPAELTDFRDVNLAVGTKADGGLQQQDVQGSRR